MNELDDIDLEIQSIIDTDDITEVTQHTLTPTKKTSIVSIQDTPEVVDDTTFDRDFDYIRKNIKSIIENGTIALEQMLSVAQESEHPRAYEVVATLLKTLAETNKDLLAAHKSRDERTTITQPSTTNVQNNNNTVFVGSTAEFSKMFRQQIKDIAE